MTISPLSVSLVIPAYNEENHLRACLEAACRQSTPFDEIIVVDNNSRDTTAAIAAQYPGVQVLPEPRQGKVYARAAGFDAARSVIIARIDADTVLPADWNAKVRSIFADQTVDAVSGAPLYYDVALPRLFNGVEHFFRRLMASALRETEFLQGANMALRRSAWRHIRPHLCADNRSIHEDFDIAIHLQEYRHRVVYDDQLLASMSARCLDVSFRFFVGYTLMNPRSYAAHHVPHYRRMYPVVACTLLIFYPARALFRGRDPQTGKFSWAQLLAPRTVNPRVASVIDGVYLS